MSAIPRRAATSLAEGACHDRPRTQIRLRVIQGPSNVSTSLVAVPDRQDDDRIRQSLCKETDCLHSMPQ